jgi:hypothetical protein
VTQQCAKFGCESVELDYNEKTNQHHTHRNPTALEATLSKKQEILDGVDQALKLKPGSVQVPNTYYQMEKKCG